MTQTDTALLVQIFDRLGAIEAKIEVAAELNDELKEINEKLEVRIEVLELFKAKIGGMLLVGSTLVSGALFLLWEGLTYLIPWAKALLGRATD